MTRNMRLKITLVAMVALAIAGCTAPQGSANANVKTSDPGAAAKRFQDTPTEGRTAVESAIELIDVEAVEAVAGDSGADRRRPHAVAQPHQQAFGAAVRPPHRRDLAGDAQTVVDPEAFRRGDPPLDPARAGKVDEGQIEADVLKIAAPVAEKGDQPALVTEGPLGAHQFTRHPRGVGGRNMKDFQLGQ